MKYTIDHDLHIHTCLSVCSGDPGQTPENVLAYAKSAGLKTICLTDHYWDDEVPCNTAVNWWYKKQNFEHIAKSLPLPQDKEVRFLFGCEGDMDSDNVIGVPRSRYDDFDFIIISTTHFHHMAGKNWNNSDDRAIVRNWIERFDAVLDSDLPKKKTGIAHLACSLIKTGTREEYIKVLDLIPQKETERLFLKAAKLGLGIELNSGDMNFSDEEANSVLRIFRTAKECGCKFYLGSDAHERDYFNGVHRIFSRAIDLLDLKETDKFVI